MPKKRLGLVTNSHTALYFCRYHYSYNTGLQAQSVLYSQVGVDDEGRMLLDPNKLSDDGTVGRLTEPTLWTSLSRATLYTGFTHYMHHQMPSQDPMPYSTSTCQHGADFVSTLLVTETVLFRIFPVQHARRVKAHITHALVSCMHIMQWSTRCLKGVRLLTQAIEGYL